MCIRDRVYAVVVGRFVYGTLKMSMLPALLLRTALLTASILFIVATSAVFAWVLTVGQIPQTVAAWIAGMNLSRTELLLAVNVLLLLVGIPIAVSYTHLDVYKRQVVDHFLENGGHRRAIFVRANADVSRHPRRRRRGHRSRCV